MSLQRHSHDVLSRPCAALYAILHGVEDEPQR
jgi:hypothetical protein